MRLSVIVVNWNSRDDLAACLASLRVQTFRELEVIVVDNGSVDGSADMVAAEFSEFALLREAENLGFAEACNRGIDISRGEWVAFLNNDAIAEPRWAEALVDAIAAAPASCGMLQSLMLYQGTSNVINSTGIELAFSGGGRDRNEGEAYVPDQRRSREEIFCPTAGAAAYRRTLLNAIRLPTGYFDRLHFMYYEDMDLGWRARLAGWSALYVPDSIVHHRWHGSSRRRSRGWLVSLGNTNRVRTLLKNASPQFILLTMPRTLKEIFELVRYGQFRALGSLGSVILGSLGQRRFVAGLAKVSRRSVEGAWRAQPR
jgi:GT2 family glycosyltransferase